MADRTARAKHRTPEQLAKQKANRKPLSVRIRQVKGNVARALENDDIDLLIESLPPLQKRFCEEWIVDFNGKQAAERAGTSSQAPEVMAYMWLRNPGVKRYIAHLTEERTQRLKIDQGYVVQKLIRTIEKAENQNKLSDVLSGLDKLMKHLGMFTEKVELTGKDGEAIKIEKAQEDADEVARRIASIAVRGRTDGVAEDTKH